MNPQHLVSKTSASANWTTRALMVFREGLKPSTYGFVDRCSIQLSYRNWSGQSGSNRRHLRWQRSALPLSYTRTNLMKFCPRNVIVIRFTNTLHINILRTFDGINEITMFCLHYICPFKNGGGSQNRTDDILLAKQALSQLSYTPW